MSTTEQQSPYQRVVGWGEALLLEVHHSGGLNPLVTDIRRALGKQIGVRNTFAKLYDSPEPPVEEVDRFRAWLILTAIGQDPSAWGLSNDDVPPGYDARKLSKQVMAHSRCTARFPVLASAAA